MFMCRALFIASFASIALLLASCERTNANANSTAQPAVKEPLANQQGKSTTPMKTTELKTVEATHGPLSLSVSGAVQPNDGLTDLKLVIRLRNDGTGPVALMNGGTTRQPRRGVFFVEADSDGVVTLSQKAYPLPDPAPTVPVIPAATVLTAKASVDTTWQATLETVALNRPYMGFPGAASTNASMGALPRPIKKIRVCVAYKLFNEKSFEAIKGHSGFFMQIGTIDHDQSVICSRVIELP
jgi:hypothetical protein